MPVADLLPPPALFASAFLLLAVIALWTTRTIWIAALVLAAAAGYVSGTMHGPAVAWLAALAASASQIRTSEGGGGLAGSR
jgi:hypothetical protein